MRFYSPDDSEFKRHYSAEVRMLFSAVDCVLVRERGIYCSSELTSGLRLFETLRQYGLKSSAELCRLKSEAWFQENIVEVNIAAALEFAEQVRRMVPPETAVITPAPFSAPGWDQPQYLAFWEELLRSRVRAVWFGRNWQYSNGCTFEFAVARDAVLGTFDDAGNPLDCGTAVRLIRSAIRELETEGFSVPKLQESLARLAGC